MKVFLAILINGLLVYLTGWLLAGVVIESFFIAIVVGLVLGLVNQLVKPILTFLTFPLTVFTFGLFLLVINAAMVLLVDWIVPGFAVNGFWSALFFSLVLSLLNGIIGEIEIGVKRR